jgi:hypothetical protein
MWIKHPLHDHALKKAALCGQVNRSGEGDSGGSPDFGYATRTHAEEN